ncbi:MAG TPA: hemerythrin domain-containing protein [Nitrososphaera sp.]|nr:hemerythrin domain-containing protein [Nitrososphaera sp.]
MHQGARTQGLLKIEIDLSLRGSIMDFSSTDSLMQEHLTVRRIGNIAQICSNRLYANEDIPVEDIQIISVIIEEFIDAFHHGKEEKAYFPITRSKDSFSEDTRKFLIEHELGRRIANMLRRELEELIRRDDSSNSKGVSTRLKWNNRNKEPVARFLKSYAVFVSDHTAKEDTFFQAIQEKNSISEEEDRELLRHYEVCKGQIGGQARIEEMVKLIDYLEGREWMKQQ